MNFKSKIIFVLFLVLIGGGIKFYFYSGAGEAAKGHALGVIAGLTLDESEGKLVEEHFQSSHKQAMKVVYKTNGKYRLKDELDLSAYQSMFFYYLSEEIRQDGHTDLARKLAKER